ncbi:MAG: ligand-binding sensor domain-containing protein, partial [bacterium]
MNNILKHLILLVFITWNFSWGYSQHFKFNVYGARDGLNPFIYAINQDQAGYLVIASGAGFSRYNGFSFLNEFAKMDGSSFISCLYKDENGVVWQGHNGGGISAYNGKSILEIAPDSIVGSIIKDITGDKEGNIFFASQNKGIIKVLPSGEFNMYIGVEDKILSAIMHIGDKYFILGTSEGLGFYHLDEKEKKFNLISGINQIPSTQINCIESSRNGFLIGTSEFGFYELVINTTNNKVIAYNMGELCGLQNESVQTIYQDQEGNIWIGTTGNGVFKTKWDNISREFLSKTSFHQDNGLPSNFIRDIFEDREGNIWIGTFGKGLAMLVDEAFSRFVFEENLIGSNITSLATSE